MQQLGKEVQKTRSRRGVAVTSVAKGLAAEQLGVRAGDRLVRANRHVVRDVIDYMFEAGEDYLELEFECASSREILRVTIDGGMDLGMELELPRTKTCRNKCIFCFVSQLPKGMRQTLYVKDEDYRLSFLYGNYITLSNLSEADLARIIKQRLSPLYISVHSVDPEKRQLLLGRKQRSSKQELNNPDIKTPDILAEIKRLVKAGIRIHAQAVICPGINDGKDLEKTVNALAALYPGVESLAVVPVGLTRFHKNKLQPVDRKLAATTISRLERLKKKFIKRFDDPFVYPSDEFYLRAELPVPIAEEYGEFPQLENGVGLVRDFLDRFDALDLPKRLHRRLSLLTFTGRSFFPFLEEAAKRLKENIKWLDLQVLEIENNFFGNQVTVTGLITGADIIAQVSKYLAVNKADALFVPSVVLRDGDGVFLDDVTVQDVERRLKIPVLVIDSTPEGLLEGVRAGERRRGKSEGGMVKRKQP